MKLYQYLSLEKFSKYFSSCIRGEVHLASWSEFNDPLEGYFSYIAHSDHRHIVDAIVGGKSEYRVSCFCKTYKKFPLWAYYAGNHRGICLEYEVNKKCLPENCILERVVYSRALPQLDADQSVDEQVKSFLFTKLLPWKHECEVRLLGKNLTHHNVKLGCLTGIIFGANYTKADPTDRMRQKVSCAIQEISRRPELYQAVINGNDPKIELKKVGPCKSHQICI
jgi:hypothetical protein